MFTIVLALLSPYDVPETLLRGLRLSMHRHLRIHGSQANAAVVMHLSSLHRFEFANALIKGQVRFRVGSRLHRGPLRRSIFVLLAIHDPKRLATVDGQHSAIHFKLGWNYPFTSWG